MTYLDQIKQAEENGCLCLVLLGNPKTLCNAVNEFRALGHNVVGRDLFGARLVLFVSRIMEVDAAMKTIGSIVKNAK
jgi:hypothetical protein